jgi:hypothetical protein
MATFLIYYNELDGKMCVSCIQKQIVTSIQISLGTVRFVQIRKYNMQVENEDCSNKNVYSY